jgi:hypothetical protein
VKKQLLIFNLLILFVIISQVPLTEIDGKRGYFKFGAATLPMGVSSQEMIFFNVKLIST